MCFAFWRLAAIVEGAYELYVQGKVDTPYARGLEYDVPALLQEARTGGTGRLVMQATMMHTPMTVQLIMEHGQRVFPNSRVGVFDGETVQQTAYSTSPTTLPGWPEHLPVSA